MNLNIIRLGEVDYGAALAIQEELLHRRQEGLVEDTLLLLSHPAVLTLGKRGEPSNILLADEILKIRGVPVYEVNRGGDVTYHGPGQIVGYPIVDLRERDRNVRGFVEGLEEVFIRLLAEDFGIAAHREERKYTGVWVGDCKITAIGIAVKHWVTMHGFAFNVNTDLSHFEWIHPCGITDRGVTSLEKLLGAPQDMDILSGRVAEVYCDVFDDAAVLTDLASLGLGSPWAKEGRNAPAKA